MNCKNVFSNVLECIGNTPLIRINRMNPNPAVTLYVKLEARNPAGSIKDRTALSMIEAAEREGRLAAGKIIVEATSGNTGIGLAMVAAVKGYRVLFTMPETASLERQKILKAFGAELLLTPGALATDGAIEEAYNLVRENPDRYFLTDQYNNPANPAAHCEGTGPEIYEQTEGKVSAIVATLGTTGTAMGLLQAMKERNPAIRIIAVEPFPGHKVQGLKNMKESYVPGIFDRYALDEIVNVNDEDAFEAARRLAREEGIFAGMSSGAAMVAAMQAASKMKEGVLVAILPDGGDRYLSTNLFTRTLEPDFRFYDLLERRKVEFKPVKEGKARICVTGPPLDQPLSISDARRFLLADLLSRFFQAKNFLVDEVVLIPDFDSRTINSSIAAGMCLGPYTQQRFESFLCDLDSLGINRAYRYPRTTEHLDAITEFTRVLISRQFAYDKLRSVYFDLSRSTSYGKLSGIDPKKVRAGKTVDLSAYEKLNPSDFALLKRATLSELKMGAYVKTDWGNVIPTWHISAASAAIHDLGPRIDVVVSSMDFLFPHLENVREIGEALTGQPFADIWMIAERVWSAKKGKVSDLVDENKPVRELLEMGFSARDLRYWLLSTHYRKPIHATSNNLSSSVRGLRRIDEFIVKVRACDGKGAENDQLCKMIYSFEEEFLDSLADDLNIPRALAVIFSFIRNANPLIDKTGMGASQQLQVLEIFHRANSILGFFDLSSRLLAAADEKLIRDREAARKDKNWSESDRLRNELLKCGVRVIDTSAGSRWEFCEPKGAGASGQ
ncbi:MAG: cysteine synthase [Syntrophobacteraceae bacterium]|nr:cysteine synthase [Syntrophobacteraceae bacterium]